MSILENMKKELNEDEVQCAKDFEGQQMLKLLRWGWVLEGGLWSNPKHIDNKRRLLFTFEDAVKAERL